jgi:phthiocerol/phenolphthiocerol synthesis type-I polyketide synthase E
MSQSPTGNSIEGVAIIGMSGRFPGAITIDAFWQNLRDGVESIKTFSDEELKTHGIPPEMLNNPLYVKAGAFLNDIEMFDAGFFGINPKEAEILDPQQRFALECAWEALESAGYDPERFPGLIGVYASGSPSSYFLNHLNPNPEVRAMVGFFQMTLSNDREFLPTRISYKLNLKGPSVNVQTACSSSLVSVHLACQSLLNYQCDMALAGGVSVRAISGGYFYQEGGILSPDGHCRSFDARAQGTVFGSGVGIVVLKRLEDALADGDDIYAVVKSSAINNDGSAKIGYTAPSVDGQAKVVAEALATGRIDPESISYIEGHGTATALGDPIEVAALTEVFRARTSKKRFCALGTVKTNVGHLDAAAGVTGLIKTALSLKARLIPPSLHYEQPNPQIDFHNSPFHVNTQLTEWKANGTARRAGVSSFGIGGTNAHVILEEAPPRPATSDSRPCQLLLLSAKSMTALDTATANLAAYLKQNPGANLADVAFTLQVGRGMFHHRRMLVCHDVADAVTALETMDAKRVFTASPETRYRPVVFMFSGQGAQYINMALGLYQGEPRFRAEVDRCCEILQTPLGFDLRQVLFPPEDQVEAATQKLNQTFITQPALFVIEYALATLWMSWGIRPEAMIGHSIGEYVAACLAGVFSLEEALALVASRGQLMQEMPAGAMLTVPLSENEIKPLLTETLSLAAVNGPSLCVVSGPTNDIETLQQALTSQGVATRQLHTSHAFHSSMMEPILEPFIKTVKRAALKPPQIPYISNLTGTWITEAEATDPAYWARHLRHAVRFADGMQELMSVPDRILLEVGPGRTLSTLARQHPKKGARQPVLASVRHPQNEYPDAEFLLDALGQLWMAGASIDWAAFYSGEKRHRMPLPTYPFERRRYWIERVIDGGGARLNIGPLTKKPDVAEWFYLPSWTRSVPLGLSKADDAETPSRWLVFADAQGIGSHLAERLEQAGQDVTIVMRGEGFARLNDHTYTVNPRQAEDYKALLKDLHAQDRDPAKIAHLWSLTAQNPGLAGEESLDDLQALGFYSLLFLAQAIGNQGLTEPLHLGVVSNHLQEVTVGDLLCPQKATLLGPCKVIPREYMNVSCRSIDIGIPESAAQRDLLIAQLTGEFSADSSDSTIAYRGDYRWVQKFEAAPLDGASDTEFPLRQGGVYLITGGTGGIGLTFAEYLAQTAQAKLVLVSRSAFPDRAEWAAHEQQEDRISGTIRQLQQLEALGAEVMVVSADTANLEQMRDVLQQTRERFGALHGVIHAAGVPGGGLIQLKSPEAAQAIQSPKLEGVLVLDSLLTGETLDFFVLCSSLTSILGAIGQVDYCAANAFMDAFALYKTRRDGMFTVSINWDAWAEVGMAVKAADSFGAPLKPQTVPPPDNAQKSEEHPLFDTYAQEADEEIYTSRLGAPRHWVMDEHRIMDKPTLVGTTYLEMARAACQKHVADGTTMVIKDVIFIAPLMVAEGETREVQTVLRKTGDTFDFKIRSNVGADKEGRAQWQEHAIGTILIAESEPTARHALTEILDRCRVDEITMAATPATNGSGAERLTRHGPMSFGPRWSNMKKVYVGHNEGLALLELPDEFEADLKGFGLHPALMDLATSFSISKLRGEGFYLPFSYKRLKVLSPLRGRIFSHARYNEDPSDNKEVIEIDLVIMDEDGVELVKIDGFTMKRVSDRATQALAATSSVNGHSRNGASPAPRARTGVINLKDAILPIEGIDAFQRILSKRRLSQVIVSTMDLARRVEQSRTSTAAALLEKLEGKDQAAQTLHPRPDLRTAYVAPTNELEETVAGIWQRFLGIEKIGIHDDFIELGGHSLLGIQVLKQLEETFPIHLPAEAIFKAPTVASLSEAILLALAEQSDADRLTEILEDVEQMAGD